MNTIARLNKAETRLLLIEKTPIIQIPLIDPKIE
jgi:hypothetical protein